MKIKIIQSPPVDPECGIRVGQIYHTIGEKEEGRNAGVWILSRGGEPVKLLKMEFEILELEDAELPQGFYVVRGPMGIICGMELGRGRQFSATRMKALYNLTEGERRKLHEEWTNGEDASRWEWETKTRVSMSPDIASALNATKANIRKKTREACEMPGVRVESVPVEVKDACRSYVEMIIEIENNDGANL